MKIKNKTLLLGLLSLFIGIHHSFAVNTKTETEKEKPNIILLVADDHGTDALGCYGNPVIETPNLDKLATKGVRFTNAYCTSSSCSASRSTILTGMYNHATGHYGHEHGYSHFSTFDHIKSLPIYLDEAGYHTARIGKYHLAPESVYPFEEVLRSPGRRSDIEMAEACSGIINGEEPYFLYFCYNDPHRSGPFPEVWHEPNMFGNVPGGHPGEEVKEYDPDEVIVPPFLPDTEETREELAQYYQSVSRIDQSVGRLMELVEASGKGKNTIVIYISDNGVAFPGAKTTTYEPGIKLPCIIHYPWMKNKGIANDAMISFVDLTPTLLDFAGIDASGLGMHGKSFKNIIEKEEPKDWDKIYASHTFHAITKYYPMRVVEDREFKLIWNIAWQLPYPFASDLLASSTWKSVARNNASHYGKRKVEKFIHRAEFELYDMKNDPHEVNNLANDPNYQDQLEAMKKDLKEFQSRTGDPWIVKWETREIYDGK